MSNDPYPIEHIAEKVLRDHAQAWHRFNQLRDFEFSRYSRISSPIERKCGAQITKATIAHHAALGSGGDRLAIEKTYKEAVEQAERDRDRELYFPWREYQVALGRCLVLAGAGVIKREDIAT